MQFLDTTEIFSGDKKNQFWADVVSKRLIPARAEFAHDVNFHGSLSGFQVGELTVCHMSSQSHNFKRTEKQARADGIDDVVATFVEKGQFFQDQNQKTVIATRGEIILYDASKTFIHNLHPESIYLVRFPRKMMEARCKNFQSLISQKIATNSSISILLMNMVKEVYKLNQTSASELVKSRFSSALLETLTTAMQIQIGADENDNSSRYNNIYEKSLIYIHENLENNELCAKDIANHVCVSERTLSRIFAKNEIGITQKIWSTRLHRAKELIKTGQVKNVSQAAILCGFNELSHFSKAFKAEFGICPSDLLKIAVDLHK